MTDPASITKMPPMNGSNSSCLIITATVPIAPPSASEPTSPMNTSAGCALYQRNPMAEPTMALPDNHNHNEGHERQEGQRPELGMSRPSLDHQVRVELLEEWDHQPGGVLSAVLQNDQCDRNQDAGRGLKAQLGACGKAEIAVMNNFKVVVGKTDRTEGQRGKHRDPDERIAQVCPEQCRHQDGDGDQQAAHGRRARLFLMGLRTFLAYVLPDLKIAQAPNHDEANRSE